MRGSDTPDFRDRLEFAGLTALLAALRLAGERGSRTIGLGLGATVARGLRLRREVALENLAHAFPASDAAGRKAIYRRLLAHLGVVLADFARLTAMSPGEAMALCPVRNLDVAHRLRDAGGGALFLTAHYGNWEALAASVTASGVPLTVLGGRQRNPLAENLFTAYRARMGMKAVSVRGGLRPVVRALRQGRLVASLADQDGGPEGFFLPFLGRDASVQPGLFRLAARMGTPLVLGFSEWTGEGWEGVLEPPLEPRPVAGPEATEAEARRLAGHYTRRVEERVRERPDHWFWIHRRWRTRPPAGPAPSTDAAAGR